MKRMFLVSMFQTVSNLLKTIEPDLKNETVTYIPTVADRYFIRPQNFQS